MTKEELILANVVQKRAIANVVMEMLNQRSFGLEGADLSALYARAADIQFYFENESYKAEPDLKELRKASMKLDHILSEFLPKGKVEVGEPYLVPVGTVKLPPRPPVQVFYGWADTAEYPTEAAIMASEYSFFIPFGGSLVIPFDQVQDWKHAWFAIPDTEPLKTNWDGQNSPLNNGEIGNDNLFGDPVHIGSFHYYFTTFATIFEMPVVITGGGTEPNVIEPGEIPETITPEPPTLTANDTLNTLTAAHALGNSEILVSINGAAYVQYTGVINVGDVDRVAGYYKFKIKAAQYRNESSVVNSPEFTKVPVVIPDQYTLTVQVNGVSNYTVYVNGAPIVGNTVTVDEDTVLSNITVIRTGYNVTPSVVPSVTMDQDRTLVFEATEIPVTYPDRILTVVVNGLHEPYQIFINGVEQTDPLLFPHGTILDDVVIQVDGYTIAPTDYDGILMDQNRTLTFTATRITHTLTIDTGGIPGVELYIDDVLHTGALVFNYGEVLENVSIHKAGYVFTPASIPSVAMTTDRTISFTGTAIPTYTLNIDVQGTTGYTLTIDGQVRTGTSFTYNEGAVIGNVAVTKSGWTFTPANFPSTVMDGNKTLTFVAEEIPNQTLTINVIGTTGYTVRINGVVQSTGVLSFPRGTVLSNIVVSKPGWSFSPASESSLIMDEDKVLTFEATEITLQIVGSRNRYLFAKAIDDIVSPRSFFSKHTIYYAADSFRLEYHNASTAQDYPAYDRPGFDVITIKSAIIYNGVRYPVLFSGSNTLVLQMGDKVKSDIISGLSVPNNAELTIITYASSPGFMPSTGPSNLSIGEGWATGDYTGSGSPSLSWGPLFTPVAVFARPVSVRTPVVLLLGDSIMKGSPDALGYSFLDAALQSLKIPSINMGAGTDYAKWFVIRSNNPQRWKYIESGDFTHAVIEYGFADLNDRSFSQIVDDLSSLYMQLKAYIPNVYKTTITPSTASNDNWATASGQSTFGGWENGRIAINAWIRGTNPYDGIVDVTSFMEVNSANVLTENGGRFLTNGTPGWPTVDGIHLSFALNAHIANGMSNSPEFAEMFQLDTGGVIQRPSPPSLVFDDNNNTLTASHAEFPDSEIEVNENNTGWVAYTGTIQVGNVNRAEGYWLFRIKSTEDRYESLSVQSPPFAAEPFTEGVTDLVLTEGENLTYNPTTKSYSRVVESSEGYGWNANNFLPINGSAAIYFDTSVENIWVGFHTAEALVFRGDMELAVTIGTYNREIYYSRKGDSAVSFLPPAVPGNDYRLVCRHKSGSRVWRLERSPDDWATYEIVHTFSVQANSSKLYPVMFIPAGGVATGSNFKYEVYADQNIDEIEIITPEPPTNGIVDVEARTFSYDIPEGYVLADIEYTLNGGATVLQSATNPLIINGLQYDEGEIGVRIKASSTRNFSAWLFNNQALPLVGDYLDGFNELVPIATSGYYQYEGGIMLAESRTYFANPSILPVGGEIAVKFTANTYLTIHVVDSTPTQHGFWLDNDGVSGDWSGYPNFKTNAAAINGFLVYSRKSLSELEVYWMQSKTSARELLHTFNTATDTLLNLTGDLYRAASEMAYLQGKNLA